MLILLAFAFLAGLVTILSPCILPILPVILSSSVGGGKRRPVGILVGFVSSFTMFTLFLTSIVKATGIGADSLRVISVVVILTFGLTLVWSKAQAVVETLFSKLQQWIPRRSGTTEGGFGEGMLIGASLGLLWTPCVGPILASVISLALIGEVTLAAFWITLAYSIGTVVPMFLIITGGRQALYKMPGLLNNTARIQRAFGILMILTAVGIFFGVDRKFQAYVLDQFPQYGTGLTNLEDNAVVRQALDELKDDEVDEEDAGKPIWGKPMNEVQERSVYPVAPELVPGGEWFNSEPLTLSGLRGKVVLIDFWTYSCINCIRTMPYLRDWWSKYEDDGLVIIGVHAPEFEFEKSAENVARAIEDFELTYPVMQDNDFATWRAYDNRYWPAKYLIDKNGQIRYTHFGEGKYAETEEMIQKLLQETGVRVEEALGDAEYTIYSRTPEIYLGYGRMQYLASGEMIRQDEVSDYNMPTPLATNSFGLGGMWKVTEEYAQSGKGSALALQFDAREVFLVMRSDVEAEVKVWLDGEPATQAGVAGSDVGDESTVKVQIDRLYRLIELPDAGQHELLLEFEDVGVQVFAFTFG